MRFIRVASSERSNKRPSRSPANARPRRKVAPVTSAPAALQEMPAVQDAAQELSTETSGRNVGSMEGALSLTLVVLLVVAALFPRSIRQLLMLGIGGGLLYRGTTGRCEVYRALGVNTTQE